MVIDSAALWLGWGIHHPMTAVLYIPALLSMVPALRLQDRSGSSCSPVAQRPSGQGMQYMEVVLPQRDRIAERDRSGLAAAGGSHPATSSSTVAFCSPRGVIKTTNKLPRMEHHSEYHRLYNARNLACADRTDPWQQSYRLAVYFRLARWRAQRNEEKCSRSVHFGSLGSILVYCEPRIYTISAGAFWATQGSYRLMTRGQTRSLERRRQLHGVRGESAFAAPSSTCWFPAGAGPHAPDAITRR